MRRLLALALGLCLFASPALAFGTLTFITNSSNSNNTGSVHSILSSGSVTVAANTFTIFTGDVVGLNSSSDSVVVSDPAGNAWTVYQCPVTAGSTNVSWVAWSLLANGLTAQKVTVADTANAGTTISASGAMFMLGFTLSGVATSSPEDTAARACNGNSSATTSPTVTGSTPIGSGEYNLAVYMAPQTSTSFSYTADAGHGWSNIGVNGTTRQTTTADTQTNATSSGKIDNPTTTSAAYALLSISLCPTGGCVASGSSSYGGGTTVGVGH